MRDIPVSEASATVHSVRVMIVREESTGIMIIDYTTRDQIKICKALASNITHGGSDEISTRIAGKDPHCGSPYRSRGVRGHFYHSIRRRHLASSVLSTAYSECPAGGRSHQ